MTKVSGLVTSALAVQISPWLYQPQMQHQKLVATATSASRVRHAPLVLWYGTSLSSMWAQSVVCCAVWSAGPWAWGLSSHKSRVTIHNWYRKIFRGKYNLEVDDVFNRNSRPWNHVASKFDLDVLRIAVSSNQNLHKFRPIYLIFNPCNPSSLFSYP